MNLESFYSFYDLELLILQLIMDQECYEVSWHTFHDHLQLTLQNLLNSDCFADVTLVCEDKKQYKAHKLILSACSSMFKSIINDFSSNNSVIFLKGIKGHLHLPH